MIHERQPFIDFRRSFLPIPERLPDLDFTIQSNDPLASYIADRLPNAKARKELQAQLDDNEHQILRCIGE
jgi:hypothetical protein